MYLYISNLSVDVSKNELKKVFGQYGTVTGIEILRDSVTNNPIGEAVIAMPQNTHAAKAISSLNLTKIKERTVLVGPAMATGNRRTRSRLKNTIGNTSK